MFRLRDGWAIERCGMDGLGGWCVPHFTKSGRCPIRVSRRDMLELLNRGLIQSDQKGLTGFIKGPTADQYLRVVKGR